MVVIGFSVAPTEGSPRYATMQLLVGIIQTLSLLVREQPFIEACTP